MHLVSSRSASASSGGTSAFAAMAAWKAAASSARLMGSAFAAAISAADRAAMNTSLRTPAGAAFDFSMARNALHGMGGAGRRHSRSRRSSAMPSASADGQRRDSAVRSRRAVRNSNWIEGGLGASACR